MKRGEKGYSLIEVLAAFAIISIAILPIMSMYPAIFKQNKSASEIEEASRIALTIVDYIKARGYTDLNNNRITQSFSNNNVGTAAEGYNVYNLEAVGSSFKVPNHRLDQDLGFTTNAAVGVIFLNSKGLRLKDETVIAVRISRTNVNLAGGAQFRDPVTGGTTATMYGNNSDQFITGRVIIGWSKIKTPIASPTTRQQRDQNIVGREKSYGVDFVITPRLQN
jgi:prepilin-type N-terminal cleavage/methylation domain-containing protein